ncbi:MAG: hypothetical protein R3F49_01405 [Planctomycetota bacterium]
MTDAEVLAYLDDVLRVDPAREPWRILELRSARQRGQSDPLMRYPPGRPDRAALEAALDGLRRGFFERAQADARADLEALDLAGLPDLERTRARLLRVNELRDSLAELAQEPLDAELVRALHTALVAPSLEARSARDASVRMSGAKRWSRHSRRFARRVRARYPEVAALEPEWLERLQHARREVRESTAVSRSLGCFGAYLVFVLGGKLVRALIAWTQSN